MKHSLIRKIVSIHLEEALLGLLFCLDGTEGLRSMHIEITEDGESIVLNSTLDWPDESRFCGGLYTAKTASLGEELFVLQDAKIQFVRFGMGNPNEIGLRTCYYFWLGTDKADLLFFNNGDEGCYSLGGVDTILEAGTFQVTWTEGNFGKDAIVLPLD